MKKILNKIPIGIMILGSISLFLLNFVYKKSLTEEDYGRFSMLSTYITLLGSFGLFGGDQLILRKGKASKNNSIELDESVSSLVVLLLFSTIILSLVFKYLNLFDNVFKLISFTFFSVYIMLSFNVFRLLKKFILAQIIQAIWKGLVLIFSYFLILEYQKINYNIVSDTFYFFITLSGIVCLFITYKKVKLFPVKIKKIKKEDIELISYFFISLLTISIIGNGDRLIMEQRYNLAELGNYFFMGMIILFPFNFIQSYLGFIYIVDFKESTDPKKLMHQKNKSILKYIFLLTICIILLLITSLKFNYIQLSYVSENWVLIFIFYLTGILRIYYSVFSSWMGALGKIRSIRNANLISLITTVFFISILLLFDTSILVISFVFFIIWLIRLMIWQYYCLRNEN